MVARDKPVALATALIPPRPKLNASVAAQIRRVFSFKYGANCSYFALMALPASLLIISSVYTRSPHLSTYCLSYYCKTPYPYLEA